VTPRQGRGQFPYGNNILGGHYRPAKDTRLRRVPVCHLGEHRPVRRASGRRSTRGVTSACWAHALSVKHPRYRASLPSAQHISPPALEIRAHQNAMAQQRRHVARDRRGTHLQRLGDRRLRAPNTEEVEGRLHSVDLSYQSLVNATYKDATLTPSAAERVTWR
jgi:hypothetical protein